MKLIGPPSQWNDAFIIHYFVWFVSVQCIDNSFWWGHTNQLIIDFTRRNCYDQLSCVLCTLELNYNLQLNLNYHTLSACIYRLFIYLFGFRMKKKKKCNQFYTDKKSYWTYAIGSVHRRTGAGDGETCVPSFPKSWNTFSCPWMDGNWVRIQWKYFQHVCLLTNES